MRGSHTGEPFLRIKSQRLIKQKQSPDSAREGEENEDQTENTLQSDT
jgi:hypothetical protein